MEKFTTSRREFLATALSAIAGASCRFDDDELTDRLIEEREDSEDDEINFADDQDYQNEDQSQEGDEDDEINFADDEEDQQTDRETENPESTEIPERFPMDQYESDYGKGYNILCAIQAIHEDAERIYLDFVAPEVAELQNSNGLPPLTNETNTVTDYKFAVIDSVTALLERSDIDNEAKCILRMIRGTIESGWVDYSVSNSERVCDDHAASIIAEIRAELRANDCPTELP